MTNFSASPIEELNAAIESHNPFALKGAAVRIQDVWGQGFPDISTLNAHASDAVFQAIKQVSSGQGKVTSIAITAEQGVGKTHLISRIRHRLQAQGGALFVYASASKFSDLDRIQYQFLQTLGDSLSQVGSQGVKQWQELATAMLNQTVKNKKYSQESIKQFPLWLKKYGMDKLTQAVLKTKPHISDPDVVRAILWTLSEAHAPFAIKWLSGLDISEKKAAELDLPNIDKEDREANAFDTVLQILSLISDYSALTVCFDQLEGVDLNEGGYTKAQVVASQLVSNLFESLNLASGSRGVVILTVMIPDTWKIKIKPLPGGIPYRVSTTTKEPIELQPMDGDSIVELVTLWLNEFYESRNLVPPHPVYPFVESQLRELSKEKPPVRKVLQWCAGHFEVNEKNRFTGIETPPTHPVEAAFNKELAALDGSIATLLEDKTTLAKALRLSFDTVIGQTIEKVKVEDIVEVEAKGSDRGYIDFKIIGNEKGKTVKIGVAVIQQSSGIGVQAGLKRLIDYKKFNLTRGCLVRSKEISPSATKAQECLSKLLSQELGGEWVSLTGDNIKPLLAILFVYEGRDDYELSEEQILDFIVQKKLATDNYLINEILSDPSGEVPSGLVDEDSVV
ncbi:P-loop NTPase fold protein [Trichocoleus sp. DQ-U1]|uniref:P-loop NTPase fold protein n=1 Tax=Trichocoleus sp. DQ-U1 TaxID=2933926 RepID=UPI003298065A